MAPEVPGQNPEDLDPVEGRANPGGMVCDHVVPLLTFESGDFEQLLEALSPHLFEEALRKAPPEASIREIYADVPDKVKFANSVLHHEQDHLRRQFGTTYGHLVAYLYWQVPWLSAAAVEEKIKAQSLSIPLWDGTNISFNSTVDAIGYSLRLPDGDRASMMAAAALALCRALEVPSKVKNLYLAEAMLCQIAEAGYLGQGSVYQPTTEEEWDVFSQDEISQGGGLLILEMMAVLEQYNWLAQYAGPTADLSKSIETNPIYRLALQVANSTFMSSFRDTGTLKDRFISDSYRMAPVEFYAIADLSLWIPFVPVPSALPARELTWSDLNPWHRFLTLIDLWKEAGLPCTSITDEDASRHFDEFQVACCENLGWDNPKKLAEIWRDYLSKNTWHEDGFHSAPANHESFHQALRLMELRLQDGLAVTINDLDWHSHAEEFSGERFRAWVSREVEGLEIRPVHESGQQTIRDWLLLIGSRFLVEGRTPAVRQLSKGWKETLVDVLDQTFAKDLEAYDRTVFVPALRKALGLT